MFPTRQRSLAFLVLLSAIAVLFSCSSGNAPPKAGTPAYYWQAAKETFAAGDYTKTIEHLDNLLLSDNEYTRRALPWALVLKSGIAAGYAELAENYTLGLKVNRSDPSAFRRAAADYRGTSNRMALQFAEDAGKIDKLKDATVALAFGYPRGSAAPVPQFVKIVKGMALAPADADNAQKLAIERGILLSACRAAGAPDDSAKTQQILSAADAQVPKGTFLLAVANSLYSQSQLYTSDKLDDPQKVTLFCQRASDTLKNVTESKDSKDLTGKIQKAMKKAKKT